MPIPLSEFLKKENVAKRELKREEEIRRKEAEEAHHYDALSKLIDQHPIGRLGSRRF